MLLLNECLMLFISLSTQSGNFWIHPRSSSRRTLLHGYNNRTGNITVLCILILNVQTRHGNMKVSVLLENSGYQNLEGGTSYVCKGCREILDLRGKYSRVAERNAMISQ